MFYLATPCIAMIHGVLYLEYCLSARTESSDVDPFYLQFHVSYLVCRMIHWFALGNSCPYRIDVSQGCERNQQPNSHTRDRHLSNIVRLSLELVAIMLVSWYLVGFYKPRKSKRKSVTIC